MADSTIDDFVFLFKDFWKNGRSFFFGSIVDPKAWKFYSIIYFVIFVKLWEENLVIIFFTMLNREKSFLRIK